MLLDLTVNVKSIVAMCVSLDLIPKVFSIDNLLNHLKSISPP